MLSERDGRVSLLPVGAQRRSTWQVPPSPSLIQPAVSHVLSAVCLQDGKRVSDVIGETRIVTHPMTSPGNP